MEAGEVLNCTVVDEKTVECFGERFSQEEGLLKASNGLFWVYLCLYIVLVLFAGQYVYEEREREREREGERGERERREGEREQQKEREKEI